MLLTFLPRTLWRTGKHVMCLGHVHRASKSASSPLFYPTHCKNRSGSITLLFFGFKWGQLGVLGQLVGVLGQLVGVFVPAYFSPLWGGVGAKPRDYISLPCFFIFLSKGMRWVGLVFKFRLSYWEYESAALRGKFALANVIAYFFDVICF